MKRDVIRIMRSVRFDAECRPHSCDDVFSVELPIGVLESMLTNILTVSHDGMRLPRSQINRR
jgi:hypothetical protein